MIKLTLELNDAVTVYVWPKWKRAAVVTPLQVVSLSLDELLRAIKMARKKRTDGGGR